MQPHPTHRARRILAGAAALLCSGVLAFASSGDEPAGGLKGKIHTPKVSTAGKTSDKDLVIYLVPKRAATVQAPSAPVVVAQKQLNFQPHVLPVVRGTKVAFRNDDPVQHNVCCKSAGKVDSDMEPKASFEFVFQELGAHAITCRLHPDMTMHVVVLETPWFTSAEIEKVEVDGEKRYVASYTLPDVPPGDYTLKFWNKELEIPSREVSIAPGQVQELDVTFER